VTVVVGDGSLVVEGVGGILICYGMMWIVGNEVFEC